MTQIIRRAATVVAAVLLALPFAADAACTWTTAFDGKSGSAVCTNNETIPTTTAQGWKMQCPKGVTFFICADVTKVLTGSGTLKVAVWSPQAALWGEVPDVAMSPTVASARCQGFPGLWTVVDGGLIAAYPVSVGVDAGGLTIYWACN